MAGSITGGAELGESSMHFSASYRFPPAIRERKWAAGSMPPSTLWRICGVCACASLVLAPKLPPGRWRTGLAAAGCGVRIHAIRLNRCCRMGGSHNDLPPGLHEVAGYYYYPFGRSSDCRSSSS